MKTLSALLLAAICLLADLAAAVEPDEILDDPALEARAREISRELRCVVCQNENIDSSNADLARDLRLLVRERLKAGDSNEEVIAFVVDRYGDFVLLRPPMRVGTYFLWFGPLLFVLIGAGLAIIIFRNRQQAAPSPSTLTPEEARRVDELLGRRADGSEGEEG